MSTEIVLSDTVPSEKDENETLKNDEESVSKDEEEIAGIEIQSRTDHVNTNECHDEDDDCHTKYNHNIFNAYILLKGKAQIEDAVVLKDLRISVYVVLVLQCAAMVVLSRLVMLQSGDSIADYEIDTWPLEHSWILFPFFIIAMVTFYKELTKVLTDITMLKHDIKDEPRSWRFREYYIIKFGELLLAVYGAFGYLVMLALYANHDYGGMLFTVLKMLAYKFILQLDEGMVSLVDPELRRVLEKEAKPGLEHVFTGSVEPQLKYITSGYESRPRMQCIIIILLTYALVLQALYSQSWVLFCFIPLVWCGCPGLIHCKRNKVSQEMQTIQRSSIQTVE